MKIPPSNREVGGADEERCAEVCEDDADSGGAIEGRMTARWSCVLSQSGEMWCMLILTLDVLAIAELAAELAGLFPSGERDVRAVDDTSARWLQCASVCGQDKKKETTSFERDAPRETVEIVIDDSV